jgi:hypothetical protein
VQCYRRATAIGADEDASNVLMGMRGRFAPKSFAKIAVFARDAPRAGQFVYFNFIVHGAIPIARLRGHRNRLLTFRIYGGVSRLVRRAERIAHESFVYRSR